MLETDIVKNPKHGEIIMTVTLTNPIVDVQVELDAQDIFTLASSLVGTMSHETGKSRRELEDDIPRWLAKGLMRDWENPKSIMKEILEQQATEWFERTETARKTNTDWVKVDAYIDVMRSDCVTEDLDEIELPETNWGRYLERLDALCLKEEYERKSRIATWSQGHRKIVFHEVN